MRMPIRSFVRSFVREREHDFDFVLLVKNNNIKQINDGK